jgi:hypothetical protein
MSSKLLSENLEMEIVFLSDKNIFTKIDPCT